MDAIPARSPGLREGWHWRAIVVWVGLSAILMVAGWQRITNGRFGDPDDALRLVEVRDLLHGQPWFDLHQYRIAAPAGVAMHWSRLVDIPLALAMLGLGPFIGAGPAETVTLVAVPLLTLLAALLLIARLTARLFDAETATFACFLIALPGPLLFQMMPNRIDHHGWQVVMALAALNGLAARNGWKGGLAIGAALAASLTISIEGLPLATVFLGVLAWRGLTDRTTGFAGLAGATGALAGVAAALFLAMRGPTDLSPHCDQISPVHLAAFGWVALVTAGLHVAARASLPPRLWVPVGLAGLAAAGAGALNILLAGAPQCVGGAFVALDPLVRRYWYDNVGEGLPIWHAPAPIAVAAVVVPMVALIAAIVFHRRAATTALAGWWRDYAVVLGGAAAIGIMVTRASATSCAFAAPATAGFVLRWVIGLRDRTILGRIAGYAAIGVLLLPALPVIAVQRLIARPGATLAMAQSVCRYDAAARALDALPATDLFAPLDIGPDLIARSHHRVVATGHHRASAAMHDVIAAFMARPDAARALVSARHASLIVICPDLAEPALYAHAAPDGLMAHLLAGRPPAWLTPLNPGSAGNLRFWKVSAPARPPR